MGRTTKVVRQMQPAIQSNCYEWAFIQPGQPVVWCLWRARFDLATLLGLKLPVGGTANPLVYLSL